MSVLTLVSAVTRDLFADAWVPARAAPLLRLAPVSAAVAAGAPPLPIAPRLLPGQGDPTVGRHAAAVAQAVQVAAGVWRADTLHTETQASVRASGHAALDAELPGGGWPLGALVELLPPTGATVPVWPLLGPALAAHQRAAGGTVVLVNPPHEPFLPALAAAGLGASQLLWVRGDTAAAQLWASEQALRCADVAAVLAWLPRARSTELRRLHAAAAQGDDGLLFVVRPSAAAAESSCARLRLRVAAVAHPHHALGGAGAEAGASPVEWEVGEGGASQLRIELLKRRGPPLTTPLWVPAQGPALRALLAASAAPLPGTVGAVVLPFQAAEIEASHGEVSHALDRLAVAA